MVFVRENPTKIWMMTGGTPIYAPFAQTFNKTFGWEIPALESCHKGDPSPRWKLVETSRSCKVLQKKKEKGGKTQVVICYFRRITDLSIFVDVTILDSDIKSRQFVASNVSPGAPAHG